MISLEVLFLLIILGFVTNYLLGLNYLKGLRGERKQTSDWVLISCSIFFGSLIVLFMYLVFDEIRMEDKVNKRRLLISQLLILVVEVVVIVLLFYFNIISTDIGTAETTSSLQMF